jgi:PQQ-dependent catabolism-associated CXXCW motif protein
MITRNVRLLVPLMVWLALSATAVAESSAKTGTLIINGGGASSLQAARRVVALVGVGRTLCFITTANPGVSSDGRWFKPLGLDPKPIKVTAANAGSAEMAAQLSACDGYYFDGGLPQLLSDAFIAGGRDSLALTTIRQRFRAGALVAGSSAGAMILGEPALCTCGAEISSKVLHGQPPELSQCFGFVHVPIDAHAFTRNLYGRELATMGREKWPRLLAIDESTAVEVPGDGGPWRVLGDRSVALITAPVPTGKPLIDYDISFLHSGDQIDPTTFEAITTGRTLASPRHDGINEILQASVEVLPGMASSIAAGQAEAYAWDAFWDPGAPARIRLAFNDNSQMFVNSTFDNKQAYLIAHLTLSVQLLNRDVMAKSIVNSDDRFSQDWGAPPHEGPRKDCVYVAVTPTSAPGVTLLDLAGVKQAASSGAVLINALPADASGKTSSIQGSTWLSGAGLCGIPTDEVSSKLADRLTLITHGDLDRPLVFYCASAACWHSYNAAQRARLLGYRKVYWYRDGLRDWMQNGEPVGVTAAKVLSNQPRPVSKFTPC